MDNQNQIQKKIKIVHWSDYACPFCYIGDKRFEDVIDELQIQDKIEFEMKAYQLDKDAPKKPQMKMEEIFAKRNGLSIEGARDRIERISALGKEDGLDMKFATVMFTNTLDAHRLTKYIASKGKDVQKFSELLYYSYFTKNLNISDRDLLVEKAEKVGIDKKEAMKFLKSKEFIEEVRQDEAVASDKGIRTIPHYIINDKYTISGSETKLGIKNLLEKVLNEQSNYNIKGMGCGEDKCEL